MTDHQPDSLGEHIFRDALARAEAREHEYLRRIRELEAELAECRVDRDMFRDTVQRQAASRSASPSF